MSEAPEAVLLDGLYPGALLALAAWSLAVRATRLDRVRLLYAGLVAGFGLSSFAWDGLAEAWPWPDAEAWRRAALVVVDAAVALLAAAFTRELLETRRRTPRIDPLLRALLVLAAAAVLLAGPRTFLLGMELVGLVTLVGPPILLAAGIAAWRGGVAPARAFLVAQGCLLAGLVVEAGALSAAPAWTGYGLRGGTLLLALVLSHALAVHEGERRAERERLDPSPGRAPRPQGRLRRSCWLRSTSSR